MFRLSLILLIILPCLRLYAGVPPRVEKQPDWVSSSSSSFSDTRMDQEAEDGYINVDYEKQVCLDQQAVYYKKVTRILSEAGVQNNAQVSVNYDPSYQQLLFHTVRIIREGQSIDKMQLTKLKTVQQEKELDRFIYNGKLTAVLILDDVRKGDIIEYSYTIKGFNPIFSKYAESFDVQFGVPVYHLLYKLIVPAGRAISVKNSLTDIKPVVSAVGTQTSYEWNISNVAPVHEEAGIPSWYNPYATIMVSEFKSWKEVNDWALALFPATPVISEELQKKISEIKRTYQTSEERAVASLRFVQDDIRYMGIEMGVNTHKPHTPSEIFAQRFGDCKDKAYLLCTMLRAMDITADPVLINTTDKNSIQTWLPSSGAFDHATVHVVINGKTYWFDPTISNQRGNIDQISFPDYQVGLVLNPSTTALTKISLQDNGKVDVKELFKARDKNGPAKLLVTTTYTGSFADDMRSTYKTNSIYELKKSNLNFYLAWFGKINMDSLSYADDDRTGAFTVKEYYTIDSFWYSNNGAQDITFQPYVITGIIRKPKENKRMMPFSLDYPATYHEEIEVDLPYEYNADEFTKKVETDVFNLGYSYTSSGSKVLLDYNYEGRKDNVMPGEKDGFLKKMDEANESIAYTLGPDNNENVSSAPVRFSSHSGFDILYVVLGACVGLTWLVKKKKKADMV